MRVVAILAILLVTAFTTTFPSSGKTPNPAATVYDSHGNFVEYSRAGSFLTISKTFLNTEDTPQEFTVIFEVRMNDVTQYMNFSGGVLPPSKSTRTSVTWDPAIPGEYQIRVLVVSNMTNPVILESVATSRFMIL